MSFFVSLSSLNDLEGWRSTFEILLVFSASAVFIGVFLEMETEPDPPKDVKTYASGLVANGMALELVCVALLWPINILINSSQNEKIEELRAANLKLEAEIQPRRLDAKQRAQISSALAQFSGLNVVVTSYGQDAEAYTLGSQIIDAFNPWIHADSALNSIIAMGGAPAQGVFVSGSNKQFVDAITSALRTTGRLKVNPGNPGNFLTRSKSGAPVAASIFVGIKPIQ